MSENLEELAGRYREILRHAVYLVRSIDAEGEISTGLVGTLNMVCGGPLRVSDIAKKAGIRVPSATEQIIKLEAAGLVARSADASDARVVLVSLTELGRQKLSDANARRNASMAAALRSLTETEREAVKAAIPAIDKLNSVLGAVRQS